MQHIARSAWRPAARAASAVRRCTAIIATSITSSAPPAAAACRSTAASSSLHSAAASSSSSVRCFSSSASGSPSASDLAQWQSFNSSGLKFLSEGDAGRASLLFMSAMREEKVAGTVYQYLSLSNLGICFRHLGQFAEARGVLLQATQALREFSSVNDGMVGSLHREVALCMEALGQHEQAQNHYETSLHHYEQYNLAQERAVAAAARGSSSATAGSAASPAEQRKHLLEQAGTHYSLGLLMHKTAAAAAAATTSSSSPSSPSLPNAAAAVIGAAAAAKSSGKPVVAALSASAPRLLEAKRHYMDALRLMRALHGQDPAKKESLLSAPVLASLGTLQADLGEAAHAMDSFMAALEIYQQHKDPRLLPLLDAYMALLQKQDPTMQQLVQQAADNEQKK